MGNKGIVVLSLFDGISAGRLALERADILVEKYYASEIDKYAISITQHNYPDTIQLGDVEKVDFTQFEGEIDLLIGGSPCTNLSIAGNRKGLKGDESRLFWEYVRAIKECKPKYFFLENVESMSDSDKEIISKELGCYPICINSALLSGQNRKRYYWFNWGKKQVNLFGFPTCDIPQPEDKRILLKDILESGYGINTEKYAQIIKKQTDKSLSLCARDYKGFGNQQMTGVAEPITPYVEKKYQEFAEEKGYIPPMFNPKHKAEITDKSPTLLSQGDSQTKNDTVMIFSPVRLSQYEKSKGQAQRVYSVRGKSVVINGNGGGQGGKTGLYKIDLPDGDYIIRKLTPIECERLQTMPDNYTEYGIDGKISNAQRYKCIGNSWTVDVISYMLGFLKQELDKQTVNIQNYSMITDLEKQFFNAYEIEEDKSERAYFTGTMGYPEITDKIWLELICIHSFMEGMYNLRARRFLSVEHMKQMVLKELIDFERFPMLKEKDCRYRERIQCLFRI